MDGQVKRRIIILCIGSLFVFCIMMAKAGYGQASGSIFMAEVTDSPTIVPTTGPSFAATPLPAGNAEILANGNFEMGSRQPDLWQTFNKSKDKVVCNTAVALQGNCAYRFTGVRGENARLVQQPDVSAYEFVAGDRLTMRVYYKTAKANPKLKVRMTVIYADATREVTRAMITIPSSVYRPFELPAVNVSGDIARIKVQFQNKARSGKVFLDGAALIFSAADGNIP